MITGKVIIDGVDVKSTYGAYVIEGGFVDIPCIPDMKKPAINDWYEFNGIEADLESPRCMPVEHTIVFMMGGELDKLNSFIKMLRSDRALSFEMIDISRTEKMRIKSINASGIALGLYRITVTLSNDNPIEGLEYNASDSRNKDADLMIDGKDISAYGLSLVDTLDGLWSEIDIKDNVLHSSEYDNGEKHYLGDDEDEEGVVSVTYNANDIVIDCLMTATTFEQFWSNRDALALDLFKPGERVITYKGVSMRAYYKSCRPRSFMYSGKIWWMFELSFGYLGGE